MCDLGIIGNSHKDNSAHIRVVQYMPLLSSKDTKKRSYINETTFIFFK